MMSSNEKLKTDHPSFLTMDPTMVTIFVGPEKKPHTVHMDLLTHYSDYFRAMFKGSFKEAEERKTSMEDVQDSLFGYFLDWLYHQTLPCPLSDCTLHPRPTRTINPGTKLSRAKKLDLVTRLYALGDQYEIPNLRRDAIDHIFYYYDRLEVVPDYRSVILAYDNLPEDSPLCQLLIDRYCRNGYRASVHDYGEDKELNKDGKLRSDLPYAFLLGMMIKGLGTIAHLVEGNERKTGDVCDYHEHADDEERKKCKEEREARTMPTRIKTIETATEVQAPTVNVPTPTPTRTQPSIRRWISKIPRF
ncbi:uncharacterized protein BDZ99DRAFT_35684 [Mytilinidion resinicola]|uniref:BTB domain-containing protein n=1 Tax=Mytilinidion resinicola TaxID=574789 RepID=A0A6A6YLT1_9PEZI|nr:uncharacterized protein BDZ99DRAFT_35684 [Mytilinidion resinicola]KAF2809741.1 hypothetical protein BDZ99DRAFT_35684 [Mytilinidion resinicola]